jgi:hypothetical protein
MSAEREIGIEGKCREIVMSTFAKSTPLTETELNRLGEFLKNCKGEKAMNIAQLE